MGSIDGVSSNWGVSNGGVGVGEGVRVNVRVRVRRRIESMRMGG